MIWLLRHGDAEDGPDDDARRLSAKGERQAAAAGAALAALGVELDACLTSPKVRALDTARIACERLGITFEVEDTLRGNGFDPADLVGGRGETLLVGHEPDFSNTIGQLTGARVKLKKGGLAGLDGAALHALLRPSELMAIANQGVRA